MAGRPDPRRRAPQGPRINHQIRIRQVRVIDEENKQLGIMETADALALAVHKQLDLVEIAPNQRPPVCRIMDFGKFKYEEKKKEQASRRKQHQVQVKELRVRPAIGQTMWSCMSQCGVRSGRRRSTSAATSCRRRLSSVA